MARYLINRSTLAAIHRIDRETDCYWACLRESYQGGEYYARWKKQYDDLVLPTFGEARAELVRRLEGRLRQAEALTQCDDFVTRDEEDRR